MDLKKKFWWTKFGDLNRKLKLIPKIKDDLRFF